MSKISKTIAILGVVAGLGVAALPLSTYAAPVEWAETGGSDTTYGTTDGNNWVKEQTTVQLEIEDLLSIETNEATIKMTSTDQVDFNSFATPLEVTVISKNNTGYNLTMVGTTAGEGKTATSLYNNDYAIPTGAFAVATPLTDENTSVWGYAVLAGTDGETAPANYKAVAAAAADEGAEIHTTDKAGQSVTSVVFGAKVGKGQAAGLYEGEVTFTATNKAN